MWKESLKDYFKFTRKERTGIIIILFIILFFIISPLLYPFLVKKDAYSYNEFEKEINSLEIQSTDSLHIDQYAKSEKDLFEDYSLTGYSKNESPEAEVFYFDPNTATYEDWQKLGIREKIIRVIQNYLSKGGKFYKAEDIKKIWGLPPGDANRLIPFIIIKTSDAHSAYSGKINFATKSYSKTVNSPQTIDINLADTNALISLQGIGNKLAQRIIKFRDKLGGFYSVDQVGETYLLPDSTFRKIKPMLKIGDSGVRQININNASVEDMKSHPYLDYNISNAIFQYRKQHGNFHSVEEIKKIILITDDLFEKVAPYLTVK
jgi:competence ComEA-like helix-hairpin-helix protein